MNTKRKAAVVDQGGAGQWSVCLPGSSGWDGRLSISSVRVGAPTRMHRTAGFSLVEVLCAILIVGVALTGLVQGVTTGLSSSKDSELQTMAALFAAGQVETLRTEGTLRDGTTEGECGPELELYRWQQTISPAGVDGLHEVAVSIENARSGKIIYELRTLLFEVPVDSQPTSSNNRRDVPLQRRKSGSR